MKSDFVFKLTTVTNRENMVTIQILGKLETFINLQAPGIVDSVLRFNVFANASSTSIAGIEVTYTTPESPNCFAFWISKFLCPAPIGVCTQVGTLDRPKKTACWKNHRTNKYDYQSSVFLSPI